MWRNRENGGKSEIRKKTGWEVLGFDLIVIFLNSDGCGWICIAQGWQWPTFPSLSF